MSIIGAEDEDFENDLDPTVDDHSSHFTSIELVKSRPTHLLVFLQHVILQFDCSSLLCYLHADLFKNLSTKETKKQFVEFYNSFLDKSAVSILRVQIPHNVSFELDRTRPDLLSEEQQRKFVQDVQLAQAPEVLRQLEDFRRVGRSESARVDRHSSRRRGSSRAKQSRSRSDVDLQAAATAAHSSPTSPHPSNLSLSELFATEHAHVRMLSVLQTVFWKPLEREELMTATELATIFPSLDEIIDMHYAFYEHLKKLRQHNFIVKAIGTTLLNRFGGTEGEWFQKLTSRFCSHQTWALEQLKMRQKKDPRFNSFILEAESRPQCRRLQLKDIIPTEMQRLTKYPLLLENIAKCTEDTLEKESIQQSAECCRKILNHVNEEVKQMENLLTLKDYQRRLDTSGLKPSNELYLEYKYLDLAQRRMIYEGPLTWRVTKEKTLEVQCVLLGDLLVLLQKQDDKMVLKCQSKSNIAVQEGKQMLSPIIKLDSAFLREVATGDTRTSLNTSFECTNHITVQKDSNISKIHRYMDTRSVKDTFSTFSTQLGCP
uniref:DH domain-containing protein n=1 Tax=Oncorhynchus tshawytscha TaxID=74940 RepID=A0AAZ3SGG9_ONCTS